MKTTQDKSSPSPVTRRSFLKTGAIATAGIASLSMTARAQTNKNSKLRIFQIGVDGIGGMQRGNLKTHPMVEFAGFCDVDSNAFGKVEEFSKAWKIADYREAFADRVNDFDAVIVDTPDFDHAPMMLTALKHNKHLYGQKPLVQQLDELRMMRDGLAARPELVTQMGNQRSCNPGRMRAVEILRSGSLGKPVEAHVWTGGISKGHYFDEPWAEYKSQPVPSNLNWDLWQGPLTTKIPYSDSIAPRRWRAYWETGGGQLADWGCHLLDLLYFSYDMPAPEAVVTYNGRAATTGHANKNMSVITYPGGGQFSRDKFVVHYNDDGINPSFAALGLPPLKFGANHTMVVCENGVIILQADGAYEIYRNGKLSEDEDVPRVSPRNHWKDWADNCMGDKKPLWTPLTIGWRITEPALLATKATRFPGQELRWDAKNFKFTNHDEANETILKREYRKGFEPPIVA